MVLAPHCVVVVSQAKIESKLMVHLPIILQIEIPVWISDADEPRESDLRQNERLVIFQGWKAAELEDLFGSEKLVQPIGANLRPKMQGMCSQRFRCVIEDLKEREGGDLIELSRPWKRT